MNKGFSLVELIVVIAIMAILVGVAVPVYTSYIGKANDSVDKQLVDDIDRAIEVVLIDQEIANPATGTTIALSKAGELTIVDGADAAATAVNGDFLAAVKKIIKGSALKGSAYENGVTFTITKDANGIYSCAPTATPAA